MAKAEATEAIVSKRLIISGLMPAIDANTLTQRLSSFGRVHSLVGVGMLDANGAPRKFAHLTMETTKAKLSRCMQAFSGSTWKGAKLRLGEAKPNFTESSRFRKRALEDVGSDVPPTKRTKTAKEEKLEKKLRLRARRLIKAKHAQDMSLVTPENVDKRKFWRSTSDGHIIRPIRMRPLHPLPPILLPKAAKQPAVKSDRFRPVKMAVRTLTSSSSAKKRFSVPSQARPTIIDPTRYGARHLSVHSALDTVPQSRDHSSTWEFNDEREQWVRTNDAGDVLTVEAVRRQTVNRPSHLGGLVPSSIPPVAHAPSRDVPKSNIEPLRLAAVSISDDSHTISARGKIESSQPSQPAQTDEISKQLADEKAKGLAVMQNLLTNGWLVDLDELEGADDTGVDANIVLRRASVNGSGGSEQREDEDWSSEDASDPRTTHTAFNDDGSSDSESSKDDDNDEVQMQTFKAMSPARSTTVMESSASPLATKDLRILSPPRQSASTPTPVAQTQSKSLKEMFAPREDEGGFSLFGNLAASGVDLDDFELESEQEQSYHTGAISGGIGHSVVTEDAPVPASVMRAQLTQDEVISLDPSVPLLFPVPPRLRGSRKGARPKDIFDIAKDKGWAGGFYRTATDDEIRQLWESVRGDLTRQYKKRHREAVKKRRRGHGITMADREAE